MILLVVALRNKIFCAFILFFSACLSFLDISQISLLLTILRSRNHALSKTTARIQMRLLVITPERVPLARHCLNGLPLWFTAWTNWISKVIIFRRCTSPFICGYQSAELKFIFNAPTTVLLSQQYKVSLGGHIHKLCLSAKLTRGCPESR